MRHGFEKVGAILVILGATACVKRPRVTAPTAAYDCSDVAIVLRGDQIEVRDSNPSDDSLLAEAYLERRDPDAAVFTTHSAGDAFATEYVVANDPAQGSSRV